MTLSCRAVIHRLLLATLLLAGALSPEAALADATSRHGAERPHFTGAARPAQVGEPPASGGVDRAAPAGAADREAADGDAPRFTLTRACLLLGAIGAFALIARRRVAD